MRSIKNKFKAFLLVSGILISMVLIVLAAEMVWPSSSISPLLDRVTILGYPLSGYSEQISLMVLREESESIETEQNILLVNLRGEPEWNKEWQETARVAFRVLPDNLKRMVTKERPLRLAIKRKMRNNAGASYNPVANTIILSWEGHAELPASGKRRVLVSTIFHEFGHAVDAVYRDGGHSLPKNKWLSYDEWKSFLGTDRDLFKFLEKEIVNGDLYLESFAMVFQEYITDEVFRSSVLLDRIPDSRQWMKTHIFQEEPRRKFLMDKR